MKYFEYQVRADLIEGMNLTDCWRTPDSYIYLEPFTYTEKQAAHNEWRAAKLGLSQGEQDRRGIRPPIMFHVRCLGILLLEQVAPLVGCLADDITVLQLNQGVQSVLEHLRAMRCDLIFWNSHEGVPGPIDDIEAYIIPDGTIKFSPILYRGDWIKDTLT